VYSPIEDAFERIACDAVMIGYAGMAMSRYVLDHRLEGEKKAARLDVAIA